MAERKSENSEPQVLETDRSCAWKALPPPWAHASYHNEAPDDDAPLDRPARWKAIDPPWVYTG